MLQYWGKARGADTNIQYHPAAYHCLDVAACAQVLIETTPLVRTRLAELLGTDDTSLVVWLIALHDVGKFSRPFQAKVSHLWPDELGAIEETAAEPHHDEAGFWLWRERLHGLHPQGMTLLPLARAVFGHHGSPVAEDAPQRLRVLYGAAGTMRAEGFAREVTALLMPSPPVVVQRLERAAFLVSGLTVLADWIGSSKRYFEYTAPTLSLAEYWNTIALPTARRAVAAAGVLPVDSAIVQTYGVLTGVEDFVPSDMQAWAETVELADGPGLYVIEDATGSGKTEAALMLAHRLIAAGRADGLYVALPTMATADGMYERLAVAYRRLFAGSGLPSLVLTHGGRDLHDAFQRSILDVDSDSRCSAWIADDRRKSFLAHVGVGTVDQAILGVLPSRHQSLRLYGLAQRVLILDEVHAYDAYMSQEIERLLQFHGALGGSAILLSATLPSDAKRRLLAAYGGSATTFSDAYPLATVQSAAGVVETPRAPRPDTVRSVPVEFVREPRTGLRVAVDAARSGQAVLYVRNSVADAVEAFEDVPDDVASTLFHARFAACDRAIIQTDVLGNFGRRSTPEQRSSRLVVATQVVEQSLDLDFDLIVTDLAPVDLIIQRAGRLWRHRRQRPANAQRHLVVVSPDPDREVEAEWLRHVLPRTSLVYGCDARLWLTADVLQRVGSIDAPHGLRHMIETVYAPEPDVPAALRASLDEAHGKSGEHRGIAVASTLVLSDGYVRRGPWLSDERIPTRLGLDTITLRLAVVDDDGRVVPWATRRTGETDVRRLWALSEVRVARYLADAEATPASLTTAAEEAKRTWSEWDQRDKPLVILSERGLDWSGQVRSGTKTTTLTYTETKGLRSQK